MRRLNGCALLDSAGGVPLYAFPSTPPSLPLRTFRNRLVRALATMPLQSATQQSAFPRCVSVSKRRRPEAGSSAPDRHQWPNARTIGGSLLASQQANWRNCPALFALQGLAESRNQSNSGTAVRILVAGCL